MESISWNFLKLNVFMKKASLFFIVLLFISACNMKKKESMKDNDLIRIMVLDPGHFHAVLVLKEMYPGIDSTVYVYAPAGLELDDFLQRVEDYNSSVESPTFWKLKVYTGTDFLEKILEEKPGNLVVLAGNNKKKTEYIQACINAGLNVYSDKPMAIESSDFEMLKSSFIEAEEKGLVLYDIMTERFEITTMLQKAFSEQKNIFGELVNGSIEEPAITKESVHHFYKVISGKPITRPAWFFDVKQEGEAVADVGTHLVDLILWEAFPDGIKNYQDEIKILKSERWPTDLSPDEFRKLTGLSTYPDYLVSFVKGDTLKSLSNSSVILQMRDVIAKVSVEWAFQAPEGAGDTHYSIMKGTISDLVIQQGPEENYRPELYIRMHEPEHAGIMETNLQVYLKEKLSESYPGLSIEKLETGKWILNIPNKYRTGHEAHFAEVTMKYLDFLDEGQIPSWEIDQMLTKYYTTTKAVALAE
jgi:predicted dehydrogenase